MERRFAIRPGEPADAGPLSVLATQVWTHTYATDGISNEIADYLLSALAPASFAAMLIDAATQVLVASHRDHCIGLAVVHVESPCPCDGDLLAELRTLYVQEHRMGEGVGSALLDAASVVARERVGRALWLTVNARNDHAIAFYARRGYVRIGTADFVLGNARHENHVLVGPGFA